MTEQHPPLTDIKRHISQVLDQFYPEKLPEISLFLEHLLKMVNTPIENQYASNPPNQSLPTEEPPWLKFAGMYGDDFDWETFQAGIDEYRREIDTKEGVL